MDLYEYDLYIKNKIRCTLIGVDEAGRGPLAGPVVAAAVLLDLSNPIHGINDSKKLSAAKREILYKEIIDYAVCWSVGMASVEEIDRMNILQASLLAMKRALDAFSLTGSKILIDGNQLIRCIPPQHQCSIIGGDSKSASIAAASIIAKITRDRLMQDYHTHYPEYGFDGHKGYPTAQHRQKVLQYGLCPIHRKSFCKKLLTQVKLPL